MTENNYTVKQVFNALRYIRSRINANDFMELFFPEEEFDDYHVKKWEMFRDDICGFWCYSDYDRQATIHRLVEESVRD